MLRPIPICMPLFVLLAALPAQRADSFDQWSTYLGGTDVNLHAAVAHGPGGLVTVAGTTRSPNMATPGAFQTVLGGDADAFVARFDPSLPPAQQLLWYTYLGGSGIEVAFDLAVDAQGDVIVVGVTGSTDFPLSMPGSPPTGFQTSLRGGADGFVVRLHASGALLQYASLFGGHNDDRCSAVALAPDGRIALVGVTESLNLSATTGTIGPAYRGGNTDAFVALIDPGQPPAQQLAWAAYLGGTSQEGPRFSQLAGNGGLGVYWLGNLKRQDVVFDPNGDLVVVTITNPAGALLTANALQSTIRGGDLYLCWISNDGRTLNYGTYFGGGAADVPAALAVHPAGGVVVAGYTGSTDMPTTSGAYQQINYLGANGVPTDGMVCWIDPRQPTGQHLRYATYCGGDGGEDLFTSIAIDRSGLVTVAGTGFGGGQQPFPTTPDPAPRLPGMRGGAVVQLVLDGNGPADFAHGLLLGDDWTVLEGVAVDESGGVVVVGATNFPGYPTSSAYQPAMASWLQGVVTRRPLLPWGSSRREQHLAEPACAVPLHAGLMGAPVAGGPAFSISASNAPPLGLGALVFGGPRVNGPAPLLNAMLLVEAAMISDPVGADALGFAQFGLTVPAGLPRTPLHVQWVFLTNAACPGSGPLSTSERLVITTF